MSLEYEQSSELLHFYDEQLFLNARHPFDPTTGHPAPESLDDPDQRKLLHTWIISVFVKQDLVQAARRDLDSLFPASSSDAVA